MFGKLLTYDFRSMFKQFAFVWPAALVLALVNHFTVNSFITSASDVKQTVSGVAMLVYVAILMAMFIIALVAVIQRFYKGLLGDEGYLMHTLPVKPWQLIASKLVCAVVMTFISIAVALVSMFLIFPLRLADIQEICRGLGSVFSHWNIYSTHAVIAIFEILLLIAVSFMFGYLELYLSMSIGHLFNKNRIAWSVVAFIVLNTFWDVVGAKTLQVMFDDLFIPAFRNMDTPVNHLALWAGIGAMLVPCAVCFAATEYILRNRLNLE